MSNNEFETAPPLSSAFAEAEPVQLEGRKMGEILDDYAVGFARALERSKNMMPWVDDNVKLVHP